MKKQDARNDHLSPQSGAKAVNLFLRSFVLLLIENGLTLGIRTSAEFRLVISFDRVQTECKLSWMDRIRVTQKERKKKRQKIIITE